MKSFIKIFPHILVWAVVLIVPTYLMSKDGIFDSRPFYNYAIRIVVFAILFYLNYFYLIEKFLFKRKIIVYIAINIGLIVVLVALHTMIFDMIMPSLPPEIHKGPPGPEREGPHEPFFMRFMLDYISIIFVIGLSVAIKTTIRWYRDSLSFEQQKSIQLEADLRNLRSQLNPHFLFNTLNNIYSLIAIDQNRAQEAVHRLSNLLRFVMYDNDEKFVSIDKELEFTRNYIDLMKLRLSPSVRLDVTIESPGTQDMIASLMFITLIENAFKHGINSGKDSFIDISILVDPGKGVICTVENSYFEKAKNIESQGSGIGLANLSKRLELLYPNKHEFVMEKRTDSFFALLRIDLTKQL